MTYSAHAPLYRPRAPSAFTVLAAASAMPEYLPGGALYMRVETRSNGAMQAVTHAPDTADDAM